MFQHDSVFFLGLSNVGGAITLMVLFSRLMNY